MINPPDILNFMLFIAVKILLPIFAPISLAGNNYNNNNNNNLVWRHCHCVALYKE